MPHRNPLFIPLKAEHFDDFESGEKGSELRPYGQRWNEDTCSDGRLVILARGYGKQRRLYGRVRHLIVSMEPSTRPEWVAIYGPGLVDVAVIVIDLEQISIDGGAPIAWSAA